MDPKQAGIRNKPLVDTEKHSIVLGFLSIFDAVPLL